MRAPGGIETTFDDAGASDVMGITVITLGGGDALGMTNGSGDVDGDDGTFIEARSPPHLRGAYHRCMRILLTLAVCACLSCAPTLTPVQSDAIEAAYKRDVDACIANAKTKAEGETCLANVRGKWGRQ